MKSFEDFLHHHTDMLTAEVRHGVGTLIRKLYDRIYHEAYEDGFADGFELGRENAKSRGEIEPEL